MPGETRVKSPKAILHALKRKSLGKKHFSIFVSVPQELEPPEATLQTYNNNVFERG